MTGRMGGRAGWLCGLRWLLVLTGLATGAPAFADTTYIYDELGRLRAVIDPSQTDGTAIYQYDSVGNVLSITRQPSSQVAIIEFDPKSGPVGTTVAIQGTGYSPTASQNTVTFNGTAATVTSATANQLMVTVPAGATTGSIVVTWDSSDAMSTSTHMRMRIRLILRTRLDCGLSNWAVQLAGTSRYSVRSDSAVVYLVESPGTEVTGRSTGV